MEWNRESGQFGDGDDGDFNPGSASVDLAESFGTAPIETSEIETVPNDFDMTPADFGAETEPIDTEDGSADTTIGAADTATRSTDTDGESDTTEMAPAEIDLALDEIEKELAGVERALERLDDGSYGLCDTCGDPLTENELETAPAGRFCRAHLPFAPG